MKLVSIAVNNFRRIHGGLSNNRVELQDGNTLFIFGQNNVGKTSFLRAYDCFYRDSVSKDDFPFGEEKAIEFELELGIDPAKDESRINTGTNKKYENLKRKYLDSKNILKVRKRFLPGSGSSQNETYNYIEQRWEEISYGGIGAHGTFQNLLLKPLFIEAMPSENQVQLIVNEVLKEAAESKLSDVESKQLEEAKEIIAALQEKMYDPKLISEYKEEVNKRFNRLFNLYEIDIDDGESQAKYTTDKLGKKFTIDFRQSKLEHSTNPDRMGHGAVRMAIFLLMLMRDKLGGKESATKDYLVLFEEPELFLHPRLTKKLRNLIYDVGDEGMPFQVLCASHSPQMIDITKDHSSIVRMAQEKNHSKMYQVQKEDLVNPEQPSKAEVRQKLYEVLRFDPYLCESFYADEVVLIEGDTEAIVWRAYLQKPEIEHLDRDIFIVNCKSSNNIPFYQRIFSKFNIPYSVICDTDHRLPEDSTDQNKTNWDGKISFPRFTKGIQRSITEQFYSDQSKGIAKCFFVFDSNFETAHGRLKEPFKYSSTGQGKVVSANNYWEQIDVHQSDPGFKRVPMILFIETILKSSALVELVTWLYKIRSQKQVASNRQ